ncbi:MAG: diguanylate cyclase [SAR324 cluster bacterium]|nr:diguanylate cyclase [SAR324 cluster bacterium]
MGKVLIIDDSEDNLFVASQILARDHHEIITFQKPRKALDQLAVLNPDVILLDVQIPEMDGFEVCRIIKQRNDIPYIPVVFVTAKFKTDEALATGLAIGGEDYIVKPFSNTELRAKVHVMIRLKRAFDALAEKNMELVRLNETLTRTNHDLEQTRLALQEQAITDPLTGIYNRRYLTDRLGQEVSSIKRNPKSLSLLMLDIDHFKHINDTYGHQCGDYVLTLFASILRKNLRQHDIVARYGGEEFVILLQNMNPLESFVIAERIRRDVESTTFIFEREQIKITTSIGLTSVQDDMASDLTSDSLLKSADTALYEAKSKGRNQTIPGSLNINPVT